MSVPAIGCLAASFLFALPGLGLDASPAWGLSPQIPAGSPRFADLQEESASGFVALPVSGAAGVRCSPPDQERPTARRLPGVINWLVRWARGYDIERSSAAPPLLYLRSPLRSGFDEPAGCPPSDDAATAPVISSCVAIVAGVETGELYTWLASLPQLGARTPSELERVVGERLRGGETVTLRGLSGAVIEFSPAFAGAVRARICNPERG